MEYKIIFLFLLSFCSLVLSSGNGDTHEESHHKPEIHLASWNGPHVGNYLIVIAFVIFAGFAKVVFEHLHFLSSRVPESWWVWIFAILRFEARFGSVRSATFWFRPTSSFLIFWNCILPPLKTIIFFFLVWRTIFSNKKLSY